MPSLSLVDAGEIATWANSRRAQETLPRLVRRLIHATTTTATHVGLPAGDAVQYPGWDGVVVINEDHFLVPRGVSVWEMGTNADVLTKANVDYAKRRAAQPLSEIGEIIPSDTTFVFVTPRRWSGKAKWAAKRRKENFWKDVRVLDVDDLIGWCEQAPSTHIWLSILIGKRPIGADDLEAVWRDWSDATSPALSPELMFAGRGDVQTMIVEWLGSGDAPQTIGLESESREEAVALVAAAIFALQQDGRVALLSRTVLVRDADALSELTGSSASLVLVTAFVAGDGVQRAVRAGHRVLVVHAPGEGIAESVIVPRVHRYSAEEALVTMGLSQDHARELAGVARRSMLALRRHLATSAGVRRPPWASPESGPSLLPLMLLSCFNEDAPGDREVLSAMTGERAEVTLEQLARWAAESDPPVRRSGGVWYLTSKADAWEALRRYLTTDVLERFALVARATLSTRDPAYELPAEHRWAASLFARTHPHSLLLRRGIADSLAMLGARGDVPSARAAADVVRSVTNNAGRDWTRWAAFGPVMSSLAEAAPDVFLEALESGLDGDDSPIMGLFGHDTRSMSSSHHTELLWALERMAWHSDLLGRVALLLAQLVRRDPGGTLLNRPRASLNSVFYPWLPQTMASQESRLQVIAMLREHEPEAAWTLMVDLLPRWNSSTTVHRPPAWREWMTERPGQSAAIAFAQHTAQIVSWLLQDVGRNPARWVPLVESLPGLLVPQHEAVMRALSGLADVDRDPRVRMPIWNAMRMLLNRHRRASSKANWRLPATQLDAIAVVFERFAPTDLVDRYAWLFSRNPALPYPGANFEEHGRIVGEQRVEAARTWYTDKGPAGIVAIAATLDHADALGRALADSRAVADDADEVTMAYAALASDDAKVRECGRAFVGTIIYRRGRKVLATLLEREAATWPTVVRAEALLALPPDPGTWRDVDALDDIGQQRYWRGLGPHWVDAQHLDRAMLELTRHGRPNAALQLAVDHSREMGTPNATLIIETLNAVIESDGDVDEFRIDAYDLGEAFDVL